MSEVQYQAILTRLEAIDSKYDEKLDKIIVQTTLTNGRVNGHDDKLKSLSRDVEMLKTVRSETKGRDKAVWVVLVFVATVAGMLFQYYLSHTK